MRNLKRALSLALAAVMLVGMMVVGASAVGYNEFTDREEIVNKDAVSMLTTLGVIEGMEDGSYFEPTGPVTREQMAKMISVIMNQGADVNNLYSDMKSGLTDVANSWAKGHINFCYSQKIIAGRGDGKFDPTAKVTAAEAAKMLLVAAGYDPKIEGFEGEGWAMNTSAKASKLGIYDNYTKPTTDPLSRDDAALLIYNALDIEMIQKYEDGYAINFADRRTILSAMYGVYKVEGVVVANKWAELDGTDSDAALKDGKTILDNVRLYASTTASTDKGEVIENGNGISFNVDTSEAMLGKTVTLYIKKTTILSDSTVLGVTLKDNVNVVMDTAASVADAKTFLKGTGLTVDKDTEFYVNYGYCKNETEAEDLINNYVKDASGDKFDLNGIQMQVIDNDNDGDVDYVLYKQETLSLVTRYSEKNENLSFYTPTRDAKGELDGKTKTVTEDFADVVYPNEDSVTTDDLILYTQYGGRTYITVPELVTGVMTRVDRDKNKELYITVDGETYKQSYILDAASLVDVDIEHFDIESFKDFTTKYDFILDSTGEYVVAIRPAEESVTNYGLIVESAWTQNALDVKGQIKVLKTDGTEATYYINWDSSAKNIFWVDSDADGVYDSGEKALAKRDLERYLGTRDTQTTTNTLNSAAGTVITYSVSDDDILTIKNVLNLHTLKAADGSFDVVDNAALEIAYTGRNANAVKLDNSYEAGHRQVVTATPNLQYTLKDKYDNGDGYVSVNETADNKDLIYAVDKNTVAFYYNNSGDYGVAVGWDNMSDVAVNTAVQVYPVMQKTGKNTTEPTKLAEVVLFNAKPTTTTADWLLVLSANAKTSKILELNVVFEDGTTKAIEVSKSDYEDEFDKPDGYAYMVAYTYGVKSDGTYTLTLSSRTPATTATLLKNGTLDVASLKGLVYPTVITKSNVWDVTDMSAAGDNAATGKFVVGSKKNAVVITNNADKVLQTAWIWDYDEDADDGGKVDPGTLSVKYDGNDVRVYNPEGANLVTVARAITNELTKAGFDDISVGLTSLITDSMGTVAAKDTGTGLTLPAIQINQVYLVNYNGKDLGLFAKDESVQLLSSAKLNAHAFLLDKTFGAAMTKEASSTAAGATAGNIWSTTAVGVDGVISFKVSGAKAATADKVFAIVDGYGVTITAGSATYVNAAGADTAVGSNVFAKNTEITASSAGTAGHYLTVDDEIVAGPVVGTTPVTYAFKLTKDVTINSVKYFPVTLGDGVEAKITATNKTISSGDLVADGTGITLSVDRTYGTGVIDATTDAYGAKLTTTNITAAATFEAAAKVTKSTNIASTVLKGTSTDVDGQYVKAGEQITVTSGAAMNSLLADIGSGAEEIKSGSNEAISSDYTMTSENVTFTAAA